MYKVTYKIGDIKGLLIENKDINTCLKEIKRDAKKFMFNEIKIEYNEKENNEIL